jgi:hypothetical protein
MPAIPRLIADAVERAPDGESTVIATVDITRSIVYGIVHRPDKLDRWLAVGGLVLSDIEQDLPPEAVEAARKGRLAIPDFRHRLQALADQAGGVRGLGLVHKALGRIQTARWRVESAEKDLALVRAARWETDLSRFGMFYGRQFDNDYASELEPGDWGWSTFHDLQPPPKSDWDSPEHAAWQRAFEEWQRKSAPPFAFGTTDMPWDGVSAGRVREDFGNDGDVRPDWLIESGLEEHFEDAIDCVVAQDELERFIREWSSHAGTGDDVDKALEPFLGTWNARQVIVSYFQDQAVIVPAFRDATHAEAIIWCERNVAAMRAELAAAENSWPPEPEASPEAVWGLTAP